MSAAPASQSPEVPEIPEGFIYVDSSNLLAVAFVDSALTLKEVQVIFKNGKRHHYEWVPVEVAEAFKAADSVGRFLAANIKPKFKSYEADAVTGARLAKVERATAPR